MDGKMISTCTKCGCFIFTADGSTCVQCGHQREQETDVPIAPQNTCLHTDLKWDGRMVGYICKLCLERWTVKESKKIFDFNSFFYIDKLLEIWKPIPITNDLYEISNMGRIRKNTKGMYKIIRVSIINKSGYTKVTFNLPNKKIHSYIHRLVAIAFLDNPNRYSEVNHKEGRKFDNRASELEWTTPSLNKKHSYEKLGHTKANLNIFGADNRLSKPILLKNEKTKELFFYESIQLACDAHNLHGPCLSRVVNKKRPQTKGYTATLCTDEQVSFFRLHY